MRKYVLTEAQINSLGINPSLVESCLMVPELGYTKAEMEAAFGESIPMEKWDAIIASYISKCEGKPITNMEDICEFIKSKLN